MAHQNNQHLRDSMDPQKFIESFIEASREKKKMLEFDLKYSVSQTLRLVQEDMGMAVVENLGLSSTPSSFQLFRQIITHLAAGHGGSEQDMPQLWKDLIKMPIPPLVMKEPSKASLGSKLKESESLGGRGEQTQELNAAIINSNHSHNLSPTMSISNNCSNAATNPRDSFGIDMPVTPSESSPHEDTKLGFTVFAVELLGALSNLAVSPRAKDNQVMIYAVVTSSTFAFLISSTALLLHKKRPAPAKKMQKAAFLFGTFGFLGIIGMLLPASITWWFSISAFLVCLLMFAVATLIM